MQTAGPHYADRGMAGGPFVNDLHHTRIRWKAMTAIANMTTASSARIPSSNETVGVIASNRPARKMSVVYVSGFAKLATWIADGAEGAGKKTDDVNRKMKKANVDTIWNVSDDFNATERAIANAPKNTVPRKRAAAMVKTPEKEGLKLAPSTGNAKRKTSSE